MTIQMGLPHPFWCLSVPCRCSLWDPERTSQSPNIPSTMSSEDGTVGVGHSFNVRQTWTETACPIIVAMLLNFFGPQRKYPSFTPGGFGECWSACGSTCWINCSYFSKCLKIIYFQKHLLKGLSAWVSFLSEVSRNIIQGTYNWSHNW